MKKFIKWFSITAAALLVLCVAFTAIFVVLPLSRSMKNLREKKDQSPAVSVQDVTEPVSVPAPETTAAVTAPAAEPSSQPETTAAAQPDPVPTEYDVYRSGKFYIKGTVTDYDGATNPMELAVTDGSIYMLTAASGVKMGVMIGGGKTYLVSPEHKMYIELNSMVLSVLGMESEQLAAPDNFNFTEMRALSDADEVKETELNGVKCKEYVFAPSKGKKTVVYMAGTRLLQTDMYNEDGSLYNRMTFESVSAEIPSDRVAPPTYYKKAGLLKFMTTITSDLPE